MKAALNLSKSLSLALAIASTLLTGCPSSSDEAAAPDPANLSVDAPAENASAAPSNSGNMASNSGNSTMSNNAGLDEGVSDPVTDGPAPSGNQAASNASAANVAANVAASNPALNGSNQTNLSGNNLADPGLNGELDPGGAEPDASGLEGGGNVFNAETKPPANGQPPADPTAPQNGTAGAPQNSTIAATGNPAMPPANGTGLTNGTTTPSTNTAPIPGNTTASAPINTPPVNPLEAPPVNAVPTVTNATQPAPELPQNNLAGVPPPAETVPPPPGKPNYKEVTQEELNFWRQASEKLRNLAAGEYPSEYIVQPGDTLWDICDQLLDDAYWWPKLWTMNPDIQNPNIIEPGQKLVFQPSSGTQAPTLALSDIGKAEVVPVDSKIVTQVAGQSGHPWEGKEGVLLEANELANDPTIETNGSGMPPTAYTVAVPGFLSSDIPSSVGEIVMAGDGAIMASKGRVAYADTDNQPAAGERFLAMREVTRPVNPLGEMRDGPSLYLYTGIVGVVKTHRSGKVQLLVEDTPYDGVMPGDILVPYKNIYQQVDPSVGGRTTSIKAEVLAVAGAGGRISTTGKVIFLEREEGTPSPGDDIELFMPMGGAVLFTDGDELDGTMVARARVIDVTGESIAAVIISSTREVSIGARTWSEF